MQVHYTDKRELQDSAKELVNFDVGSLLLVVAAERQPEPEFWLAEPGGYEDQGHVLRDSDSIRLMAYSGRTTDHLRDRRLQLLPSRPRDFPGRMRTRRS